jgi:hypothetical protein
MLFDAILTAVLGKIAFNLKKIIQGTCLGPFCSKSGFWKGTLLEMVMEIETFMENLPRTGCAALFIA